MTENTTETARDRLLSLLASWCDDQPGLADEDPDELAAFLLTSYEDQRGLGDNELAADLATELLGDVWAWDAYDSDEEADVAWQTFCEVAEDALLRGA